MNASPTVTVVIPTYNRARTLARAMKSVLSQTNSDLELIIVDDASSDDTTGAIKSVPDNRVTYIRHATNRGVSASRNTGIEAAKGRFIGFLDSDDEWLPQKLQEQVDLFHQESADTGLVYGACLFIAEETGKTIRVVTPRKRGWVLNDLLMDDFVMSPTPLVRRECFDAIGLFDTNLKASEDWDMWLRIAERYRFDFVKGAVAKYYVSTHQASSHVEGVIEGHLGLIAKHEKAIRGEPAILAQHFKLLAQSNAVRERYAEANAYFAMAVRTRPRDASLHLHLMAARLAPSLYVRIGRWLNIQAARVRYKWPR